MAELTLPVKRRVTKVILRAMSVVVMFYITIPVLGYLSTLDKTPTIIVARPMLRGEVDYAQIIAVFAVMSVLLVKILTMIMPFKNNLY
jgi:amino acid permease